MKSKKVVLIKPGKKVASNILTKTASIRLPLSQLFIASPLLKIGYDVDIIDMRVDDFSIENIKDSICVGIGSWTGQEILYGIDIAKQIKQKYPNIPIVWGGIHPTIFPEQTIESGYCDIVVRHEGDETFKELVVTIDNNGADEIALSKIDGITFLSKDKNIITNPTRKLLKMDSIDLPAYQLIDLNKYHNILYTFDYQSSRGCPYDCKFCYNKAFNTVKWRSKSAEKVAEELIYLHKTYGVKIFSIVDDEFFISKRRAEIIAEKIIESDCKFEWSGFCRFDTFAKFSDETLVKLKKSGVDQMFFGAESGNIETLKLIDKRITPQHVIEAIKRTKEFGIRPVVSFVGGFPGESKESISDTIDLYNKIMELNPKSEINGIFLYTPYPGADLFELAVKSGFKPPKTLEEWGKWEFNYDIKHPWLDKKTIEGLKTISILARFMFLSKEFISRNQKRPLIVFIFSILNSPFMFSYKIRWKYKFWTNSIEWKFWAYLVKKVFGTF